MAFGNITALYLPTAANAGASQWGTDVRKLLDAADAAVDTSTTMSHGTGGATVRTADPYGTTTGADLDQTLYGWAVTPSDMNSVSGALRFFAAGNHTATFIMGHNGATGATGTLFMYVYRVGPAAGRTRTLLGSNSASVVLPATSGTVTATVTVALSEVIFAADETVQYSFEFECAGIAVAGRISHIRVGTNLGVAARVDTPALGILASGAGSMAGTSSAAALGGKVLGTVGAASGSSSAAGIGASNAGGVGSATGSATVAGVGSAVAGAVGAAAGSSAMDGSGSMVIGAVGEMEVGGGGGTTIVRKPVYIFDD